MLLSVPVIAPEVPLAVDLGTPTARHLRLILAMSRTGMIRDDDLAGLRPSAVTLRTVRQLIDTGWQRTVGADFACQLISAYARLILPHPEDADLFVADDGAPLVGVAINAAHPEWIVIGKAFTAIEARQPGLGRKALDVLEATLSRFGLPHTPFGAFQMAQGLYWLGEDDEGLALEEYGDEADVPRRGDLMHGVPTWAYAPTRSDAPRASDAAFAAAARAYTNERVGPLLGALAHLLRLESKKDFFASLEDCEDFTMPNEPPVVCGWTAPDDFDQMFDDNFRYYCESSEDPPWVACIKFSPTAEGIESALPRIRHTGAVLRALDAALMAARNLHDEL